MCEHRPHIAAGLCAACIAAELAWRTPYAALIIEAAQAIGWDDLAREAARRIGLYEIDGCAGAHDAHIEEP